MKRESLISVGLAMFTMFFGAGNIIYPLELGLHAGNAVWFAIGGFIITAVVLPVIGFIATILCDGDYMALLNYLGKWPAAAIAFICMLLTGPFCAIPRCIILGHAATKYYMSGLSSLTFACISALFIFLCAKRNQGIVKLFGKIFGPLKVILITLVVLKGFIMSAPTYEAPVAAFDAIWAGLRDGYGTMDLLCALLFAGLLGANLGIHDMVPTKENRGKMALLSLRASLVGGGVLSLVYVGFCLVANKFAMSLPVSTPESLFSALSVRILGPIGGTCASVIIAITCLTTAIALSVVFARYIERVSRGSISYTPSLIITLVIACVMAHFPIGTIMGWVEPLIAVCYPVLIALAVGVIIYKLYWASYGQDLIEVIPASPHHQSLDAEHDHPQRDHKVDDLNNHK